MDCEEEGRRSVVRDSEADKHLVLGVDVGHAVDDDRHHPDQNGRVTGVVVDQRFPSLTAAQRQALQVFYLGMASRSSRTITDPNGSIHALRSRAANRRIEQGPAEDASVWNAAATNDRGPGLISLPPTDAEDVA